jgi:hypothetical protein
MARLAFFFVAAGPDAMRLAYIGAGQIAEEEPRRARRSAEELP